MSGKESALGIPKGATSSFPAEPGSATDWCWLDTQGHTWLDGSEAGWLDGAFVLSANNLTAGTPVLGTPTLTLNVPASYDRIPAVTDPAYSVMALHQAVTGYAGSAIEVRRDSDNTTTDIGFDANGNLDTTTLETFCGAGNGYVRTWYDQSAAALDFIQTTDANQPQIVASGSTLMDKKGLYPHIEFDGVKLMSATNGVAISNSDVTMICVGERLVGAQARNNVFAIGGQAGISFENNWQTWDIYKSSTISGTNYGANRDHEWIYYPKIAAVNSGVDYTDAFKNMAHSARCNDVRATSSSTSCVIGSLSGLETKIGLSSLCFYPLLSDADRRDVTSAFASYHANYGAPTTSDLQDVPSDVPQVELWQSKLLAWMKSLVLADVSFTRADITWDGTYSDNDELFNLWLVNVTAQHDLTVHEALRLGPEWFVWDNGDGRGFGVTGSLRAPQDAGVNDATNQAAALANLYDTSFPLAAGEGNPYYQDAGIGNRALLCGMFALIEAYDSSDNSTYSSSADILGGGAAPITDALLSCGSLLDADTKTAVLDGIVRAAEWIEIQGPRFDNANMDAKSIPFLAEAYVALTDAGRTADAAYMVSVAKRVLFGSTTGTLATSTYDYGDYVLNDTDQGILDENGISREQGTPETTYVGQTYKEMSKAYAAVRGVAAWSFLSDAIDKVHYWMEHQSFTDSPGRYAGGSSWSGRTDGDIPNSEQGNASYQKHATLIEASTHARWRLRNGLTLKSTAVMITDIQAELTAKDFSQSYSASATGVASAHTNDVDWTSVGSLTVDTATNELVISGTNVFSVNDRIALSHDLREGAAMPTVRLPGAGQDTALSRAGMFHVVSSSGQRIQISDTSGGSAIDLKSTGYGTLYCQSILHLTNTPDLSFFAESNTDFFVDLGGTYYEAIAYDNTADLVGIVYRSPVAALNIASASPVDYSIERGPIERGGGYWWPVLKSWYPSNGFYDTYKALVDGSDPTTFYPCERTGVTHSINWDDDFWSHQGTDGSKRFAAFAATVEYCGGYFGNYGLQPNIWFEDFGVAIISLRNADGTIWVASGADTWPCMSIWGEDDTWSGEFTVNTGTEELTVTGHKFQSGSKVQVSSTGDLPSPLVAATDYWVKKIDANTIQLFSIKDEVNDNLAGEGDPPINIATTGTGTHTVEKVAISRFYSAAENYDRNTTFTAGTPDSVTHSASMGVGAMARERTGWPGLQNEDEISGTFTPSFTMTPSSGGDGYTITAGYTSDQADDVTTLWHNIPICLRGHGNTGGTDTVISYWGGGTWSTLTTALTGSIEHIRLTRNHGSGDVHEYITFTAAVSAKLSSAVYADGEQNSYRVRNILVDLHPGTTGTPTTLAASDSVTYNVQSTEPPGLTPTNPAITVLDPVVNTEFIEDGFWFANADITFYGSTPTATLRYSTDSTDGSDGTWTTIATMTNTSGTNWRYIGDDVAVPSAITYIRIEASDSAGSSTQAVACTARAKTARLVEDFIATAGTMVIGGSYNGWTTGVGIESTYTSWGGASSDFEIDASGEAIADSFVTKGHLIYQRAAAPGTTGIYGDATFYIKNFTSSATAPQTGVNTSYNSSNDTNGSRSVIVNSSTFRLYYSANTSRDEVTGLSLSTSNDYRIKQQHIGRVVVGALYDEGGGGTLLGYVADFSATDTSGWTNYPFGFSCPLSALASFKQVRFWT